MDKNTIIGFVLIVLIVIGYGVLNKPNKEELARRQHYNDSVAAVQQLAQKQQAAQSKTATLATAKDSATSKVQNDTTAKNIESAYGAFAPAATGAEKLYTIENNLVKLTISSKGGRLFSAQLKNYKTHDSLPLILFKEKENVMNFTLATNNDRVLQTSELYFEGSSVVKGNNGAQTLTMRLKTTTDAYLDVIYSLPDNDYMVGISLKAYKMNTVMPRNTSSLNLEWDGKLPQQELGKKNENRYAGIFYKFVSDDVKSLSTAKADEKELNNRVKWVAFKDQFFSSILISEKGFEAGKLTSTMESDSSRYLKSMTASLVVPFDPTGGQPSAFRMYLGPNKYKILKSYDKEATDGNELQLKKLIPLGWGIFGWINQIAIIPMFNLFSKYIGSFGLIILIMTLIIKLVLFPLTYKSYISAAKMRVLKPEVDEINARIPADKPLERQKASNELYSKVGVSPLSGCMPSLLQLPILLAMFNFFPSSIELRQQSFLWANDLSTYDSIFSWTANIPLLSSFYGNHISLFCILMTVANIITTKLNSSTTPSTNDQMGNMMKWMMYMMPVMFLFFFNNSSSGLSYYYFVSALITIIQTYVMRAFVDEKKLLAQLHAKRNSKTPPKKSGFMERLEKMQYEQQKTMKNRK